MSDPATKKGAIIDPVLDYDHRSGKASVASADAILAKAREQGDRDRLGAGDPRPRRPSVRRALIKLKTGAKVGIGEHIREVQRIFRPVFNATDVSRRRLANSTICSRTASAFQSARWKAR